MQVVNFNIFIYDIAISNLFELIVVVTAVGLRIWSIICNENQIKS